MRPVHARSLDRRVPAFFRDRLTKPDEVFANAFEAGRYSQNRGFMARIGAQILNPESRVFELLDNQRTAFALCRALVNDVFVDITSPEAPKKVITITSPPGSASLSLRRGCGHHWSPIPRFLKAMSSSPPPR